MSSKQAVRKRRTSGRVQQEHRYEPAALRNFAGTAATPVPRSAGMRTTVNVSTTLTTVRGKSWYLAWGDA